MLWKTGLFLIQVYRNKFEVDRSIMLQILQNLQHSIGIFATRQTDHNLVAIFNHIEVMDCPAHLTADLLLKLIELGLIFFGYW